MPKITTSSYRLLSAFRYEIRRFVSFSEQAARTAEIEPQQHQLLLAVRGLPEGSRPTIGAVAERLCVQHHTAVALVDKLERLDLLRRERGSGDKREVLLQLTPAGDSILRSLSALHWEQLAVAGPAMVTALQALVVRAAAESGTRRSRGPVPAATDAAPARRQRRRPATAPIPRAAAVHPPPAPTRRSTR